jgi:hypothetical protein
VTVAVASLRAAGLDDLAAMMAGADDELRSAILGECDRRDRGDRRRRVRRADAMADDWYLAAHAQYLAAEAATSGYLLNRRGVSAGIEPWSLWSGPERRAMAYASHELREFWQSSARLTVTEYRRQLADALRVQADEHDRTPEPEGLPPVADLVAMVRKHGPAALDRFAPDLLAELLDTDSAASWIGIQARSIHREKARGRWPASELPVGRSLAWSRRTLVEHLAARTGRGAPGKPRAPRKTAP